MALRPALPEVLQVLAGEELVVIFEGPTGENWSGKTFVAQVRATATADAVLATFLISTTTVANTTTVTMRLPGDSVFPLQDGVTRKIGNRSCFDVQKINTSNGKPEETLFYADIEVTPDVTK